MAQRAQNDDETPDAELAGLVRAELDTLLHDPGLRGSDRLMRFLRHVVDETLEGRSDRLTGYAIALDVFDRDEDFDSAVDSIVRVEASRLRLRLVQHYAETSRSPKLKIILPKGTYVPLFERTVRQRSPAALPIPDSRGHSIAVLPFDNFGTATQNRFFADGLTEETISNLCKFKNLFVFSRSTTSKLASDGANIRDLRETLGVDFVLEGSVRQSSEVLRVTAQLIDAETDGHIFAESFDRPCTPESLFDIQDELALLVAARIGDQHGPLGRYLRKAKRNGATKHWQTYDLINRFHAYYATHDPELHLQVRDGLADALESDEESSDGCAALAIVFLDEHRLRMNERPDVKALTLARHYALRSVQYDPENAFAYQALACVYFHEREITNYQLAAERCIELNPGRSDALADIGYCDCLFGDWDRGLALLQRAIALSPVHPGWFHLPIASRYMLDGAFENATIELRKVPMTGFPWYHAICASAHALAGQAEDAERELEALKAVHPKFAQVACQDIKRLGLSPEVSEKYIEGWTAAGMQIA